MPRSRLLKAMVLVLWSYFVLDSLVILIGFTHEKVHQKAVQRTTEGVTYCSRSPKVHSCLRVLHYRAPFDQRQPQVTSVTRKQGL